MKENVDLTENRDFRVKANDYYKDAIPMKLFSAINNNIVMASKLDNHDRFGVLLETHYINHDTGVVIQGNQMERFSKYICGEFNAGNYCDCCGTPIKPYKNDCLCSRCVENLDHNNQNLFINFFKTY